jgi:hypothetical protein
MFRTLIQRNASFLKSNIIRRQTSTDSTTKLINSSKQYSKNLLGLFGGTVSAGYTLYCFKDDSDSAVHSLVAIAFAYGATASAAGMFPVVCGTIAAIEATKYYQNVRFAKPEAKTPI